MIFTDYAASKGLVLLRDDLKFIRSRLQDMPKELRIVILRRYIDEWVLGMQECDNAVKKANAGRFKANTYLREAI